MLHEPAVAQQDELLACPADGPAVSARARPPFRAWLTRSTARDPATEAMSAVGTRVAETPRQVFDEVEVVFLMLANGAVIDAEIQRGTTAR